MKKLRMGTACYHVLHAIPPIVADEMNYFVDEGIVDDEGLPAYEIVPGGVAPFNAEMISLSQSMKEKGISIAMDVKPSSVVYLNRRGASLRIIAGWRNQQPNWVMSQPDIRSLGDVRGRTIGLKDFKNVRYHNLAPLLREAGINPDRDVRYLRNIHNGALALREGAVDVAFVGRHFGEQMLEAGYQLLVDLASRYPRGRPDRVIVATEEAIASQPDLILAYVRAMIRSYWFIRTMPDNLTYVSNLERRLRLRAADRDERKSPYLTCGTSEACEQMPFPIDGIPTGLVEYIDEWVSMGEIDEDDAACIHSSLRLDIPEQAFKQLAASDARSAELERVREVCNRVGY